MYDQELLNFVFIFLRENADINKILRKTPLIVDERIYDTHIPFLQVYQKNVCLD